MNGVNEHYKITDKPLRLYVHVDILIKKITFESNINTNNSPRYTFDSLEKLIVF